MCIIFVMLGMHVVFSRKRRRAAHHYIKKIKMGQEPIQTHPKNTHTLHTTMLLLFCFYRWLAFSCLYSELLVEYI
jgi:hypothetical protein